MECFMKSFRTWGTLAQATVLASDVFLDSLDKTTSSVTVASARIHLSDAGNWLILDGAVYLIQQVKPKDGVIVLNMLSPLDAFSRLIHFEEQPEGQTIGGFITEILQKHWVNGPDPFYAAPYMLVSNSDTTPFVPPDLDSAGLFSLADYCRMVRRAYGVSTEFRMLAGALVCVVGKSAVDVHQVSFTDGRSKLKTADFATTGVAKITAIQDDVPYDWYLSESGDISQVIPVHRAAGSWATISVAANADMAEKVAAAFAKNRSGHKVEFWSELTLPVLCRCKMEISGETLVSYISSARRRSADNRTLYTAGELASTASEKMKGAIK